MGRRRGEGTINNNIGCGINIDSKCRCCCGCGINVSFVALLVVGICGKTFGQLARRECCRLMEFNRIDEHQLIMPQTQVTLHIYV